MEYRHTEGYYHLADDLLAYPGAWCFVVWSSRGRGKTYSGLAYSYCNKIPIVYMKRTKQDVNMICNENKIGFDASPYVPINRDYGTNIKAATITDGIGGFYDNDVEQDRKKLLPVSYVIALSAAKSLKGFDLSRCEWMIFDEFIPQAGEIVRRSEGEMILDLYMTIRRDREQRGRDPLKLILFANSEDISTPITNTLEIIDTMAEMNGTGKDIVYDESRGILLHHVTGDPAEKETGSIYAAMKNTAWGKKTFGGEFSHNDFSCVRQMPLKNMRCMFHVKHNLHDLYVYQRAGDGVYYLCESKGKALKEYDLSREVEARRFWYEEGIDLFNSCIDGKMYFQKYSFYDLIMNYKRFYDT